MRYLNKKISIIEVPVLPAGNSYLLFSCTENVVRITIYADCTYGGKYVRNFFPKENIQLIVTC